MNTTAATPLTRPASTFFTALIRCRLSVNAMPMHADQQHALRRAEVTAVDARDRNTRTHSTGPPICIGRGWKRRSRAARRPRSPAAALARAPPAPRPRRPAVPGQRRRRGPGPRRRRRRRRRRPADRAAAAGPSTAPAGAG